MKRNRPKMSNKKLKIEKLTPSNTPLTSHMNQDQIKWTPSAIATSRLFHNQKKRTKKKRATKR